VPLWKAAKTPTCRPNSWPLKTAPRTVVPFSFRNARAPFESVPKKPYFVVPSCVHEHVLPVNVSAAALPSVIDAVAGAQLMVPASSSPSLSSFVFVVADDHVVESVAVKPVPVMDADVLPKLVPVPESFVKPEWLSFSLSYAVRETRVRMHQARFRGLVLDAYSDRCAICRLKESRLLDAAHIVGDLEEHGQPVVPNGLSLCSIHHRTFDQDLVGVAPDYTVHVSKRLLDDEDGPMLELLKTFHAKQIVVPSRSALRPDRERLAKRFERFADAR
jgi:hypothetical protein